MSDRQKRLNEVYEHLRNNYGIHTQGDFAKKLGYNRAVISSALNGNESNLTDRLFETIAQMYMGVFNLNYLITGEGELLDKKEVAKNKKIESQNAPIDKDKAIKMLLDSKSEQIEDLRARLKEKDEYIDFLKKQLLRYEYGDLRRFNIGVCTTESFLEPIPDPVSK